VRPSGGSERPVDLLLEAFRKGAPGAFDAIVRAHQDRIFSFCVRMLSDREDALEAAQDVFVSAFRNLSGFREEASLSTWLMKIAANRCLNRIKQRSVRSGREARPADPGDGEGPELQAAGKAEERPDRIAENREMGRYLSQALSSLDEDSRWLVLLADVEGFAYEELAEMAQIPVGTVKSRLHRARMALRKLLAPVV